MQKVLLDVLPKQNAESWREVLSKRREEYDKLKDTHTIDPKKRARQEDDLKLFNPLSTEEDSPWTAFWENEALQKTIRQDLQRTHPENPFFLQEEVQMTMLRILFVYSKEHPDTSYRQGMHEILALVIYVVDLAKKSPK